MRRVPEQLVFLEVVNEDVGAVNGKIVLIDGNNRC